jgi:hypothetical protein
MSKKNKLKPSFVSKVAIVIIKILIVILILVGVGLPIYLIGWGHPPPPEIQTVEAEVSRLWIEQVESTSGGSQIRRIEFNKQQGEKFICNLAPMAIQVWGQLEVGETYQIAVTWVGKTCYLHEVTRLN